MTIDFSQQLRTLDGEPLKQEAVTGGEPKPITLSFVAVEALLANHQNENPSGEEKVKRYALASAIHYAKAPIELVAEDVVLIKKLVGASFFPLIVGQALPMLDGKSAG